MPAPRDTPAGSLRQFAYRVAKSARFDGSVFRALRDDASATSQSILILALASLSLGLGYTASIGGDLFEILLGGIFGIVIGLIVGFLWVSLTVLVVTRLFKGASNFWSLARPVFFASSPGLIFLLMMIPGTADIFRAAGLAWISIANVVAVKNSMGFDNQRSLVTFIIVTLVLIFGYGLLISI